ncbi:hypothetical protein AURDEDRAFT_187246 [Auricularia subglabra TFB-10046 SS5]|uniref:F-box domain-containing protein n=1 Tax=Auricularia subglabra (strain TFB-10046 / SS5) TaxID=717982 RepID=J0D1M3_AURST|nr:hypothetical protein AURDEDRAFT_187246 [Auricularia subglabra TFB-10046 SS5]
MDHTHDPTSRLSPEMLAEFFEFLHLRDLISASHVSRTWRSSALAFPALWSRMHITWPTRSPEDVLNMALSRAGELPVDFEYGPCSRGPPEGLVVALGKLMPRFISFRWVYDPRILELTLAAPLLQEFSCDGGFRLLPGDFLGGSKGRLRTLRLTWTAFPLRCPALATVTYLRAGCPQFSEDLGFDRIFKLCPRLEFMRLRHVHTRPEGTIPAGPVPPSLRVVKLQSGVDTDLVQLFRASALVSVAHVQLKQPVAAPHNMSPFLAGALDLAVTFELPKKARIVANMPDASVRTLVLYEVDQVFKPAIFLAKILRDMTHRMTVRSLRIPLAVLVLLVAAELPWPGVLQLAVDIYEHDSDTQPFRFGEASRRFSWAPLDCLQSLSRSFPALTRLALSFHSEDAAASTVVSVRVDRALCMAENNDVDLTKNIGPDHAAFTHGVLVDLEVLRISVDVFHYLMENSEMPAVLRNLSLEIILKDGRAYRSACPKQRKALERISQLGGRFPALLWQRLEINMTRHTPRLHDVRTLLSRLARARLAKHPEINIRGVRRTYVDVAEVPAGLRVVFGPSSGQSGDALPIVLKSGW